MAVQILIWTVASMARSVIIELPPYFHSEANELRRVVMAVSRAAASRIAMTRISVAYGPDTSVLSLRSCQSWPAQRRGDSDLRRCLRWKCAVSGLSRISSIDGNCRKSRKNAINSAAAAGPTVPSSNCASNSLAPDRNVVFCRLAMRAKHGAISQERGVARHWRLRSHRRCAAGPA